MNFVKHIKLATQCVNIDDKAVQWIETTLFQLCPFGLSALRFPSPARCHFLPMDLVGAPSDCTCLSPIWLAFFDHFSARPLLRHVRRALPFTRFNLFEIFISFDSDWAHPHTVQINTMLIAVSSTQSFDVFSFSCLVAVVYTHIFINIIHLFDGVGHCRQPRPVWESRVFRMKSRIIVIRVAYSQHLEFGYVWPERNYGAIDKFVHYYGLKLSQPSWFFPSSVLYTAGAWGECHRRIVIALVEVSIMLRCELDEGSLISHYGIQYRI